MVKKLLILLPLVLAIFSTNLIAQTVEEYKATKAEKEAQVAALQGEIDGIQKKIDEFPGWKTGAFGTLGLNFSQFDKWISRADPNTYSSSLGFSGNGYANLDQAKYFWRNNANLNAQWTKLDLDIDDDNDTEYEQTADALNISSLFGYKLNDKWAASALGEYRTTVLSNFNNPGYLDIGAGVTWTPIPAFVAVFHPLNYNLVFADEDFDYTSSLGCKILADYTQKLPMGISWKSNLTAFVSYEDVANFSNWTWVNGLSFTAWKGIGVGFELGLRGNKQESYNFNRENFNALGFSDKDAVTFDNLEEDPLQLYWLLGFTYSL